jgi:LAS superfamily LD-carboxypeptidase LdcB
MNRQRLALGAQALVATMAAAGVLYVGLPHSAGVAQEPGLPPAPAGGGGPSAPAGQLGDPPGDGGPGAAPLDEPPIDTDSGAGLDPVDVPAGLPGDAADTDLLVGSGVPGDPLNVDIDSIVESAPWVNQQALLFEIEQTHNQPFDLTATTGVLTVAELLDPLAANDTAQAATNPLTAVLLAQAHQAWQAAQTPERPDRSDAQRIPPPTGPVTTTTVNCPAGGTITVADSIGPQVQQLLDAAAHDGVQLCGWGYRSTQRQIELRRTNGCPDIYESPSSACDVPTARPGSSMHEQGLAIDFTQGGSTLSSSDSGYTWLRDNAASYGLYNLPSESWHWSTNGR